MSAEGSKLVAVVGGGASGPVYFSTDSGNTWSPFTNSPNYIWSAVAVSAGGGTIAAVSGSAICSSTNWGQNWITNNISTANFLCIATAAGGKQLVAAGRGGFGINSGPILISTNSGVSWKQTTNISFAVWNSIATSADGTQLVAVQGSKIFASTNAGLQWRQLSGAPNLSMSNWRSIASSADGKSLTAVAGGLGGSGIYISHDAGATWISNSLPSTADWGATTSSAGGAKLAIIGYNGWIYTSPDAGLTWISNNVPNRIWQSAAYSADGKKLAVAESNGGIWISQATPIPQLICALSGNVLALSWQVPSTKFALQQSEDLIFWSSKLDTPTLNLTNLNNELTLSPSNSSGFFRLISQ